MFQPDSGCNTFCYKTTQKIKLNLESVPAMKDYVPYHADMDTQKETIPRWNYFSQRRLYRSVKQTISCRKGSEEAVQQARHPAHSGHSPGSAASPLLGLSHCYWATGTHQREVLSQVGISLGTTQ